MSSTVQQTGAGVRHLCFAGTRDPPALLTADMYAKQCVFTLECMYRQIGNKNGASGMCVFETHCWLVICYLF